MMLKKKYIREICLEEINMNIILLSGGSGTRLWPLSNEVRSKQFLKILRTEDGQHESMVQRMFRMIKNVSPDARIVIATSETQVASIRRQLKDNVDISIEPCRRDTFPAIALSAAYLHDVLGIDENEGVVICPVDPLVEEGYFKTLQKMFEIAGQRNLTLMGIKPSYPSEKYGYIIPNRQELLFKEKPIKIIAEEYIKQGALWNGGVFAFKIEYILNKANELLGTSSYKELFDNYAGLKKISFDYAVAEHEKDIKVIEYNGTWKDLGTWNTFTEAMKDATGDNCILGENCENTHIVNELAIPIIGLGLKNIVVAASPDGILVSDKEASSYLKKYVPDNRPMFEKRIWGEYRVLYFQQYENGKKCLTKELVIIPTKNISYQRHKHRNEIWTFVKGTGLLVINGKVTKVKDGDSVYIKTGDLHAIKAIDELHIIEVQIGDELIEEDIERFEWDWDKVKY